MLFVLAAVGHASPGYPIELQVLSGGACEPACTVCHETNFGGSGSVTQPFGEALVARGLTGSSDNRALETAYRMLIDDRIDSDDDGTVDAEALATDLDPNTGDALCDVVTPEFGCLSHTPLAPGLGLLGLLVVARARRQSRSGGCWSQGASAS